MERAAAAAAARPPRVYFRATTHVYRDELRREWLPPRAVRPYRWRVRCRGTPRPPHPDVGDVVYLVKHVLEGQEDNPKAKAAPKELRGVVAYASFGGQTVSGWRPSKGRVVFQRDAARFAAGRPDPLDDGKRDG